MAGDSRKNFLLATTANYFSLPINDGGIQALDKSTALNSFLDDGNVPLLAARNDPRGKRIEFVNKILPNDNKEQAIVFFKIKPDVITPDNMHSNIIISSMVDSPLSTLYHSVQKMYAPLLLEDGKWGRNVDPRIQSLLSELEAGLGSAMRKQDPSFRGNAGDGGDENLGSINDSFNIGKKE